MPFLDSAITLTYSIPPFLLLLLIPLLLIVSPSHRCREISPSIPHAPQPPFYLRLFSSPSLTQLTTWAHTLPNPGLILYWGIFNKPTILLTSAAAIHEVHQRNGYKYEKEGVTRKMLASLLGEGVVTAVGEEHQKQRKMLQKVFRLRNVKDQYGLVWRKTRELLRKLIEERKTESGEGGWKVEVIELVNRATLDIIGQAGFGLDFNCLANPDNELWNEYAAAFQGVGNGGQAGLVGSVLAGFLPRKVVELLPSKRNEEVGKAVKVVRRRIGKVIAAKKMAMKESDEKEETRKDSLVGGEESSEFAAAEGKDIISACLREGITDFEMLIDQSLGILGAGHETIAQTLCLAVYELSKEQQLQRCLRAEINKKLPWIRSGEEPTASDLEAVENLPLLNAICTETLRMYPIIPFLTRETTCDVDLLGHALPKGTIVMTVIDVLNRHPNLWSQDPNRFIPDRWLSSPTGGAKERQAFMTFGQGPRVCIGERLARAEMAIMLAGLVGSFEMEYVGQGVRGERQELEFEMAIVQMIKGGLWVKLKPVDRQ